MNKRTPTIANVAQDAGVGVSTVSRVLNGGYVSDELEEKVRAAMKRLDYTPSMAARNLKLRKTGIVGLVSADSQAPFIGVFLSGVESALSRYQASVALCSLELDGGYTTETAQRWIDDRRVDSLIFVRATQREAALVKAAREAEIPLVHVVPDKIWKGATTLRCDNVAGGRLAAEHLLNLGHVEFAFAGGPKTSMDTRERLEGVRSALAARGLSLPDARITYSADYVSQAGVAAAERYLAGELPATAVVLGNDSMALGFMRRLMSAGVSIPEQLSVVGFDDIAAASLVWPGLTTVAQPVRKMGQDASEFLLRRNLSTPPPAEEAAIEAKTLADLYPMQLIARESTGRMSSS